MNRTESLASLNQLVSVAESLGARTLANGTRLVGRVPHVGSDAWLHVLFAGLNESQIDSVETLVGRVLPDEYRWLLHRVNGFALFSGALFVTGLRTGYARAGDQAWQPFSIQDANLLERPRDAQAGSVFVGGYKADGSMIYLTPPDPPVFRCARDSASPLNVWPSFMQMVVEEANRLASHFDASGRRRDPRTSTAPDVGSAI